MELTGLGGGIMLAIAAGLWLVYLVPNWLKRREYLATERNAVRLQQTIRVLAETSEVPVQLRAPRGPVAVGRPVVLPSRPDPQLLAARRLRRTRGLALLVLAASAIVTIVAATGGGWLVVGAAGLSVVGTVALLGRLAEVARARRAPVARASRSGVVFTDHAPVATRREPTQWTPVSMPKPLYLSRDRAPATQGSFAEASAPHSLNSQSLAAAAASAEQALRDAAPPAVVPSAARAGASSRFASMGIVDAFDTAAPDLDAALARRRAAG